MGSLAGRSLNIPVIWHERNIPETNEKDITRQLIFLPDAVICNSQAVANRFSEDESLPSKVRVIPNGVNVVVFDKKQRDVHLAETLGIDGKSVVGIFTNLSDRRRVEYFIEIAKMIHGQKPDTRFIIVGGEYSREATGREELLKGMAEKAGLKKNVCFTGFQEDVTPYLSLCDVVCHVTKQDACSRAVLEAMASSKAIVAINDGGNPELIDHSVNGLLIDADDKAGFVRSVIRLLEEPSLRESLGFAARQKARKSFDVAINAQKTIEIYRQLMSRG
jgi:glycosyltransferase involved in cell wall biosynthesis